MGNLFSSRWFLDAASRVLFAGRGARPGVAEVEGQRFELLLLPDGRAAPLPLADFFEEQDAGPVGPVQQVAGLAAVCRSLSLADPDHPDLVAGRRAAAPFIDWSTTDSWEGFVSATRQRQWRAFHRAPRKLRRLSRLAGPAHFALDLVDHDLVECLLLWNSRQLRRTRRLDRFASPRNRQFVHALVGQGQLLIAGLFAGSRPVALQLGCRTETRHSCWITAYDPEFASVSPGVLLFEKLMADSFARGHHEFDFLVGSEPYKYHYATHQRLVGPLGQPSPAERLIRAGRALLSPGPGAGLSAPRQRLRAGVARVLNARLARQALAPVEGPPPSWLAEVVANTPAWPRARLATPADCQLQLLVDTAAQQRSPARAGVLQLAHGRRRVGWALSRRWSRAHRQPGGALATAPAAASAAAGPAPDAPAVALRPGDLVRVKPLDQIQATLRDGATDGLQFMPGVMERHAGHSFTVERPVTRFYDERRRRVVRPRAAVVLRQARCSGDHLHDPQGCDRGCLVFWSQAWLERVEDQPSASAPRPSPPPAAASSDQGPAAVGGFAAGQRVVVRSRQEIQASIQAGQGDPLVHFVPDMMARFCGQTLTVHGPLTRAYDERRGCGIDVQDAVLLEEAHCPGVGLTGGGHCDRACALFWRQQWLAPDPASAPGA